MSKNLPMLWHIPLSHFNEKVRWALDFKNIPHQRQRVGADYLLQAWRATGHGTLPILFLDGKPIRDSTAALDQDVADGVAGGHVELGHDGGEVVLHGSR